MKTKEIRGGKDFIIGFWFGINQQRKMYSLLALGLIPGDWEKY